MSVALMDLIDRVLLRVSEALEVHFLLSSHRSLHRLHRTAGHGLSLAGCL